LAARGHRRPGHFPARRFGSGRSGLTRDHTAGLITGNR
jgi:hypothetical protein